MEFGEVYKFGEAHVVFLGEALQDGPIEGKEWECRTGYQCFIYLVTPNHWYDDRRYIVDAGYSAENFNHIEREEWLSMCRSQRFD